MKIKQWIFNGVSGLYLGLSLISPFLYSAAKTGIWQDTIGLDRLAYAGTHHLGLMFLTVIVAVITYIFADASKYVIYHLLMDKLNVSAEDSKEEMDKISLVANVTLVILAVSVTVVRTFLIGFSDKVIKLTIVFAILLIGFSINMYLDKKYRYHTLKDAFIPYLLAIPILLLNLYVLLGIFNLVVFR